MRTALTMPLVALLALLAAPSAGQDAEPTTPHMVRAAGMPLDDGALAPGTLVVRLVEGAFTRDLAGETVVVELTGGGRQSARTGPDGRAQFDRVPVGAGAHVSAVVGGERLESESFTMPSQGGVRVLLVAGDGSAPPPGHAMPTSFPSALPATPLPVTEAWPASSRVETGVAVVRAVLATATASAFAALFFVRRRAR